MRDRSVLPFTNRAMSLSSHLLAYNTKNNTDLTGLLGGNKKMYVQYNTCAKSLFPSFLPSLLECSLSFHLGSDTQLGTACAIKNNSTGLPSRNTQNEVIPSECDGGREPSRRIRVSKSKEKVCAENSCPGFRKEGFRELLLTLLLY